MDVSSIIVIAGLVFINAFFVAAEFALVKVRISQIEGLAESGNWAAKVTLRALNRLDAYLSASQLGITVASLALGTQIEHAIEPPVAALLRAFHFPEGAAGPLSLGFAATAIALSIGTFLHMALGEQAPKTMAIRSAKVIALWTGPPLVAFAFVFWPIIWLLNSASQLTLRVLGLGAADHAELAHTEEELRHIVAQSVAGGVLSRSERLMIENVLNLEEKPARRVMVPRPDVVYLSLSNPLEENLRMARRTRHTRFPLCEDDLTRVIGLIHVKDLFQRAAAPGGARIDLRELAREIPFLPESLHLDQVLIAFQRNRVHAAMLLDEYGSVTGMITMENVLEELVGPIQDEFDREPPQVEPLSDDSWDVEAALPLDRLAEVCGITLPETEAETTGGLVMDLLGRIAKLGDEVAFPGARLTVTKTDPNRIRRVRVDRTPPPTVDPES